MPVFTHVIDSWKFSLLVFVLLALISYRCAIGAIGVDVQFWYVDNLLLIILKHNCRVIFRILLAKGCYSFSSAQESSSSLISVVLKDL